MPTKRAVLAGLTVEELRANVDYYELAVADRRVKAQLVDALAGSAGRSTRWRRWTSTSNGPSARCPRWSAGPNGSNLSKEVRRRNVSRSFLVRELIANALRDRGGAPPPSCADLTGDLIDAAAKASRRGRNRQPKPTQVNRGPRPHNAEPPSDNDSDRGGPA